MKILFFHRWVGVHSGGTETHIRELIELLLDRGHEIFLLTRQGRGVKNLSKKVKVYRLSKNPFESDHSYEKAVPLYLHTSLFMAKAFFFLLYLYLFKKERFDVISVHFVTEAVVARLIRLLFGTPYVFVLEGYTPLEGKEAKLANLAIAISQHEVEETFKNHAYKPLYIPKGRKESFNLEVDGSDVREKYLNQAEKLLIAVGRIESRKDYPTLVRAAKVLKEKGKNYRWLIIGDGIDFEKIENLIKNEGLEKEVLMLGAVENDRLPAYYRAADLFVLSTRYEGFGYVFVEAMACGLPIVSTTVGAVPEVVDGAGILVAAGKPQPMAQAIIDVLEKKELYAKLVSRARVIADNYFWGKLIVDYENAYRSVVERR